MAHRNSGGERGKLLLAVMIRSAAWMICLWGLIAAGVAIMVMDSLRHHEPRLGGFLAVIPTLLVYALSPRIKFYEGGILVPPTRDDGRRRFLHWSQISRHGWDGDKLVLTGTTAVLEGGPVEGAIVRIPPSRRMEVEQMLLLKLRG